MSSSAGIGELTAFSLVFSIPQLNFPLLSINKQSHSVIIIETMSKIKMILRPLWQFSAQLRLCTSTAGSLGSIPHLGTKILHAA